MIVALLDDGALSAVYFARIVASLGHECRAIAASAATVTDDANFGLEAVEATRAATPDLVVIDGRYGDPFGTREDAAARLARVVARFREAFPEIPLAVVAALGETALVRAAADAGAAYVVSRPYVASQLRAMLALVANERGRSTT